MFNTMFSHIFNCKKHEMNLDYILDEVKKAIQKSAEAVNISKESRDFVSSYKEKIAEQLKNSLSSVNIGEALLEIFDNDVEAFVSGFVDDIIAGKVGAINSEVQNLKNRVENIVSSGTATDGNAELIDMRTGYNGTVYDNAGKAVRTQIENLHKYGLVSRYAITGHDKQYTGWLKSVDMAYNDVETANKFFILSYDKSQPLPAGLPNNYADRCGSTAMLLLNLNYSDLRMGVAAGYDVPAGIRMQLIINPNGWRVCYMRVGGSSSWGNWEEFNHERRHILYSKDFPNIRECFKRALWLKNTDVYISGVHDISTLFTDEEKASWDGIPGIPIGGNCRYFFLPDSVLNSGNAEGGTVLVADKSVKGSYELHNAYIETENQVCCVKDDIVDNNYTRLYKNCHFNCAGVGVTGVWTYINGAGYVTFDGCYFVGRSEQDDNISVITGSEEGLRVIVSNCYIENNISVRSIVQSRKPHELHTKNNCMTGQISNNGFLLMNLQ